MLSPLGNVVRVRFVLWEDNGSTQNTAYRYGDAINPSDPVETNGPPNPPTSASCGLSGADGNTVDFKWAAPSKLNGRAIQYYYRGDLSGGPISATQVANSYPQDLASHTIYVWSRDGLGEMSSELKITCADHQPPPPGPPGNGGCALSNNTVIFKWTAPAPNGLVYSYQYSNADFNGTTSGLSAQNNYPADGASHTLSVTTYDSRGPGGFVSITCIDATPQEVLFYNNYGGATKDITNCTGGTSSDSNPGGTNTQTFTIPSNISRLERMVFQADAGTGTNAGAKVTATLYVNGGQVWSGSVHPALDTTLNFGNVSVTPGASAMIKFVWSSSTSGHVDSIYLAGNSYGTFTASNACSWFGGSTAYTYNITTSSESLRAQIWGLTA